MYLLITEEGSNSKWNLIESTITSRIPFFGLVFPLTVNPPIGVQGTSFSIQDIAEDVYYRETLNQGGRGRGGKQLQCKFARLDVSNLSSPTLICADCCNFVLVHEWGRRGGFDRILHLEPSFCQKEYYKNHFFLTSRNNMLYRDVAT